MSLEQVLHQAGLNQLPALQQIPSERDFISVPAVISVTHVFANRLFYNTTFHNTLKGRTAVAASTKLHNAKALPDMPNLLRRAPSALQDRGDAKPTASLLQQRAPATASPGG